MLFLAGHACTDDTALQTQPPAELVSVRQSLADALVERDPQAVSTAARAAGPYQGQDLELDHLLGDAFANVLMRPAEGIALLRTRPAPGVPEWTTALESAVLRTGNAAALEVTLRETGTGPIPAPEALVEWMSARALRDPHISIADHRAAAADCALFDAHPSRGRRTVDQPTPPGFFDALFQLGATRVVVGRAAVPPDPAPDSGRGLQPCRTGRIWSEAAWPDPMFRHVTVAIASQTQPLFLSVRPENGQLWVFGSTRNVVAGELVARARALRKGVEPDPDWLPSRLAEDQPNANPTPEN